MEHPDLARMIGNLVSRAPQGVPPYDLQQFYDRMVDTIKTICLEGIRKGEVKDVDIAYVILVVLSLLV
jgi:hypothetical protein